MTVTNQWTRNGADITENTITSDLVEDSTLNYTATLVFFPLNHATDDGVYQCSVQVAADVSDNYVTSQASSASTTLVVLGELVHVYLIELLNISFLPLELPNPVVSVSRTSSNPVVGDPFEFVCSVSVVDRLIVSPEITWTKYVSSADNPLPDDDISVDAVHADNENELSLKFSSLNTSDAGRYTCEAVLTVPQIDTTCSNINSEVLTLQSEFTIMHWLLLFFLIFYSS